MTARSERRPLTVVQLFLAFLLGSCTFDGPQIAVDSLGIVETLPAQLEREFPRDGVIRFIFDRPLHPHSIDSRAIDVTSQGIRQGGTIHYDPIHRELSYAPRGYFRQNLAYDATLDPDIRGLREGGIVNEEFVVTFFTGTEILEIPQESPPDFAEKIFPILNRGCAQGGCHTSEAMAASLDFSTPTGIRTTAIGVPSRGWPGWNRIEVDAALWSYLIYKIIGEETIGGQSMPPGEPLDISQQEDLARWIDGGAKVDQGPEGP